MMKKYIQTFIIIAYTMIYLPALTEQIRQLSWDDLIPAHLVSDDPLANLTQDQQDLVYWVINMLETLPKRGTETEEFYKEVDAAMPQLKKAGIDIVKVMAKRKEIRTTIVEELNGQRVRIPGYLLPLEISGSKVTEFLLVPYIGACIHVPPPPPNQIVHANVGQKGGYNSRKLYEPVWVTGVISVKSIVKDLYLSDGSAGINIGYAMQANHIEPYTQ
jgi:uncharacterized protein